MSLEELSICSLNVVHLMESMEKFVKWKELVLGVMDWHKGTIIILTAMPTASFSCVSQLPMFIDIHD